MCKVANKKLNPWGTPIPTLVVGGSTYPESLKMKTF